MSESNKYVHLVGQSSNSQITNLSQQILVNVNLSLNNTTQNAILAGLINDTNNIPIEGASIKLLDSDYRTVATAKSDSSGKYIITSIEPSSSYKMVVVANGMRTHTSASIILSANAKIQYNVQMVPDVTVNNGVIAGNVFQTGTSLPVKGAMLSMYSVVNSVETIYEIVYTNDQGQFSFKDIPNGNYKIYLTPRGYNQLTITTAISSQGQIVNLQPNLVAETTPSQSVVAGAVKDGSGSIVPLADVFLYKVNANSSLSIYSYTTTDAIGGYLFSNVPVGSYVVSSRVIKKLSLLGVALDSGPLIDKVSIAEASTVSPIKVEPTSGTLAGSAVLTSSAVGYVDFLGGVNNGSVTMSVEVPLAGSYTLGIKHLNNNIRSMKVDINGVNTGTTYTVPATANWALTSALIYNVTATLSAGINTVKVYGITTAYAPVISTITVTKNPYYNITTVPSMTKTGDALILPNGFYGGIGGSYNSSVTGVVNAPVSGTYTLGILRINGDSLGARPMRVDINGIFLGLFQVPATPSHNVAGAQVYNISVTIPAGNTNIKVYTNSNEPIAPDIYDMRLTQTQYSSLTEGEASSLTNGATISGDFVKGIGGVLSGGMSFTATVPFSGMYDVIVSYVAANNNSKVRVLVNGADTGYKYSFLRTNSLNISDIKTRVIRLYLSQGTNTILIK
ncbi:MAG: carboxypeptidase regulatory-like domain-containing protein [Clostridium sp.]